jgi:hypothetical protein
VQVHIHWCIVVTSKCHFSTLTNSIHQSNHYYNNKSSQDVLQSEDAPNKFFFYEVYQDADAIAHHKLQPVSLLPVFCIKQFTIHLSNTHLLFFFSIIWLGVISKRVGEPCRV